MKTNKNNDFLGDREQEKQESSENKMNLYV